MKQITEKVRKQAQNSWGHDSVVYHQQFEIEEGDVGASRPHYLGHHNQTIKFTHAHVGKVVDVMTDGYSPWTCWSFA